MLTRTVPKPLTGAAMAFKKAFKNSMCDPIFCFSATCICHNFPWGENLLYENACWQEISFSCWFPALLLQSEGFQRKRMVYSLSLAYQLMQNVSLVCERLFLCLWGVLFLIPNVAVNKVSIVFPPFPSAPVCSPKTPLLLSLSSLSNLLCQMMFSLAGTSNVAPIVSVLLRDSSWVDFSIAFLTTPAATLL